MKRFRNNGIIVSICWLALVLSANLYGCGAGSGSLEKQSTASLDLVFPENYSFNSATSQLTYTSAPNMMAAPSYVTSCSVTVSGADMSPVTYDVPLSTGQVSGSVPPGVRRFNVAVTTNIGLSFTGAATATLVPGENGAITIQLAVNAPPSVTLGVSNSTPKTGETISLTATVTDLDPDDTHTFTWISSGVSGSGSSVSWVSGTAGVYTVIVTVEDGRGGMAMDKAVITVIQVITNNAPVITSITADKTVVTDGDVISLNCLATDADGDTLTYGWTDGMGWSVSGQNASYTVGPNNGSTFDLTCKVSDGKPGGLTSANLTFTRQGGLAGLFTDVNLANCVTSNFPNAVSPTDVTGKLVCNSMGITDLSGIENLTGLTELFLTYNFVTDVTPLGGLTGLTWLDLGYNFIADLSPLQNLTSLVKLALYWNSLGSTSNVLSLATLTATEIGLNGNTNLTCSDLNTLICGSGNSVVGGVCSPASTGLGGNVDLYGDGVAAIDTPTQGVNCTSGSVPLAGLFADANLASCVSSQFPTAVYASDVVGSLICDNMGIMNLSGMENLTGLTSLSLASNMIADVTPLAGLINLTSLALNFNQIINASPLAGLTNLTYLGLKSNQVANVTPLAGLTNLMWLNLGSNIIVDVSPLAGLTNLADVNLEFNQIGGQGVGNVHLLASITGAQIWLFSNIGMSCAEATTLITALGMNVDISNDGVGNLDTPTTGVNCTNP